MNQYVIRFNFNDGTGDHVIHLMADNDRQAVTKFRKLHPEFKALTAQQIPGHRCTFWNMTGTWQKWACLHQIFI